MADSQEEAREQEFAGQDNPNAVPAEEEAEIEHKSIADFDPPSVRAYLTAKYAPQAEVAVTGNEDTAGIDAPEISVDPTVQAVPSSAKIRKPIPKNILSELVQPFRQLAITRREVTSALLTTRRSQQRRDSWRSDFLLWRLRRPFWGSILMLMASLMILWGPISLLRFALLPGSSIWAGVLVGILLFIMALIQLLAPSYALITGGIGVALSLVSLLVAGFGGLGIGVILGTIGSALGVAWKPNAQPFTIRRR